MGSLDDPSCITDDSLYEYFVVDPPKKNPAKNLVNKNNININQNPTTPERISDKKANENQTDEAYCYNFGNSVYYNVVETAENKHYGYQNGYYASDTVSDTENKSSETTSEATPSFDFQPTGPLFFNNSFQELLEKSTTRTDEKLEVIQEMNDLKTEFEQKAKAIAIKILQMSESDRNQLATKLGFAGGQKFVENGIFLKLASDDKGIYHGDEWAQKAASHELRSLIELTNLRIPQLSLPLSCIIDHRGHRLLALSQLPIDATTIVYGSCDAGKTFHSKSHVVNTLMRDVGLKLNLKPHFFKQYLVPTCVDLEVHLGKDLRYYLIDAARLWPPTHDPEQQGKRSIFSRLLRPEFLRDYPIPLSSDALSGFGNQQKLSNSQHENEMVETASHMLKTDLIPQLARYLCQHSQAIHTNSQLMRVVHKKGVNCRYLVLLLLAFPPTDEQSSCHLDSTKIKNKILVEIIARTMKQIIQARWREIKTGEDIDFIQSLYTVLYQVFHRDQIIWKQITLTLADKFMANRDKLENIHASFPSDLLSKSLKRVCKLLNVKWADQSPFDSKEKKYPNPNENQNNENRYPNENQNNENRYPNENQNNENRYPNENQTNENRYPNDNQSNENRYPNENQNNENSEIQKNENRYLNKSQNNKNVSLNESEFGNESGKASTTKLEAILSSFETFSQNVRIEARIKSFPFHLHYDLSGILHTKGKAGLEEEQTKIQEQINQKTHLLGDSGHPALLPHYIQLKNCFALLLAELTLLDLKQYQNQGYSYTENYRKNSQLCVTIATNKLLDLRQAFLFLGEDVLMALDMAHQRRPLFSSYINETDDLAWILTGMRIISEKMAPLSKKIDQQQSQVQTMIQQIYLQLGTCLSHVSETQDLAARLLCSAWILMLKKKKEASQNNKPVYSLARMKACAKVLSKIGNKEVRQYARHKLISLSKKENALKVEKYCRMISLLKEGLSDFSKIATETGHLTNLYIEMGRPQQATNLLKEIKQLYVKTYQNSRSSDLAYVHLLLTEARLHLLSQLQKEALECLSAAEHIFHSHPNPDNHPDYATLYFLLAQYHSVFPPPQEFHPTQKAHSRAETNLPVPLFFNKAYILFEKQNPLNGDILLELLCCRYSISQALPTLISIPHLPIGLAQPTSKNILIGSSPKNLLRKICYLSLTQPSYQYLNPKWDASAILLPYLQSVCRNYPKLSKRIHHPSVVFPIGWSFDNHTFLNENRIQKDSLLFHYELPTHFQSLKYLIEKDCLTDCDIVIILRQVAAILTDLHAEGLVLFNLNTEGLLYSLTEQKVILIDLDIAQTQAEGAPQWISPASAPPEYNRWLPKVLKKRHLFFARGDDIQEASLGPPHLADIFSFGLIAYQLLTKERLPAQPLTPDSCKIMQSRLSTLKTNISTMKTNLEPAQIQFIHSCLAANWRKRPTELTHVPQWHVPEQSHTHTPTQVRVTSIEGLHNMQRMDLFEAEPLQMLCQSSLNEMAIHCSRSRLHLDSFEWTLKQPGMDLNATNSLRWTLLHRCAYHGRAANVMLLLHHGCQPDPRDIWGLTPLFYAAQSGHQDAVQALLQTGHCQLDVTDATGKTPLHAAAQNNRLEVCRVLVDHGADSARKDDQGHTPLDLANSRLPQIDFGVQVGDYTPLINYLSSLHVSSSSLPKNN